MLILLMRTGEKQKIHDPAYRSFPQWAEDLIWFDASLPKNFVVFLVPSFFKGIATLGIFTGINSNST